MFFLLGAAAAATARRRIKPSSTISSIPRCRPFSRASTSSTSTSSEADPLSTVRLSVNGRSVSVPQGLSILEAARSSGVLIPTLCAHPRLQFLPSPKEKDDQGFINNAGITEGGLCRVCLVDVGKGRLSPACVTPVSEGMSVETDTKEVKRSVRGVLALLRASGDHKDCATCEASGECELQDLLARYHIVEGSPRRRAAGHHEWDEEGEEEEEEEENDALLPSSSPSSPQEHDGDSWRLSAIDSSHDAIAVDLSKCIECGRCVSACGLLQGIGAIGFTGRGAARHVGTFGDSSLSSSPCIGCGQCSLACPTGAIEAVPHWRRVTKLLESKRRPLAVQVAPAVRVAIGEELGLAPGQITTGQLVSALRLLGFDFVFDTNFAADVTILEESSELLRRLQGRGSGGSGGGSGGSGGGGGSGSEVSCSSSSSSPSSPSSPPVPPSMPLFTSCCPAWITMAEKSFPDLLTNGDISTTKSPHIILGTVAKKFWAPSVGIEGARLHLTSVMPCTAKKSEAARGDLMVEVPVGRGEGEERAEEEPSPSSGDRKKTADATSTASSATSTTTLVPAVDAVITTRELGRMLRARGIPLASLASSEFDSPLGDSSGAAALFGATGGVAEAALRSAYKALVGSEAPTGTTENPLRPLRGLAGVKELVLPLPEAGRARELAGGRKELRVAVASGAGAARALVERMKRQDDPTLPRFDFVEVMACPGGCVGGGGQPRVKGGGQAAALAARVKAIYAIDEGSTTRRSHENEAVKELYTRFLGGEEAGSEVAERELHREYGERER